MNPTRRNFLRTSLGVSATTAALGMHATAAEKATAAARDYLELRTYRFKPGASSSLLHGYLEKAFIPALNKRGISNIGVFTEVAVDTKAGTSRPMENSPVWVLVAHPNLDSFVGVSADLNKEAALQTNGADYLQAPKATPAFDRIDTWLLRSFAGMPKLELPAFSRDRTRTRIFELRQYESHSEIKALNKMAMFEDEEILLMKDLGMSPVMYGQALAGPALPHLAYITSGPDLATHLGNWQKFGGDSRWQTMSRLPKYADNVSKNTARFIVPTPYSQI